jgi:tricorn protease
VLRVGPNANGRNARDVTVVPLANDFGLRTRQWMEDNRKKVDEMSGGRLAYVYLPNTAQAGYANFNRYYYAQQDKLGAVIDERFNGGGKAADYIVEFMDRPLMSNWASRNGESFTSPNAAIFGPKVMIINEWAGSGGDYMPWAFKKRGVGPLIGRRTWGGLIGVSQFPALIDGGFTTAPSFAIYSTDPDNPQWIVENEGVAPDIEVDINPADVAAGRDPQLERAVQECLRLLEANPVRLAPRPEPIDRVNGSGR